VCDAGNEFAPAPPVLVPASVQLHADAEVLVVENSDEGETVQSQEEEQKVVERE
jgi:hypothetical protein